MDVHGSTIERNSDETSVVDRIHLSMHDVPVLQLTVRQALRIIGDPTRESVVTLRQNLAMVADGHGTNFSGRIL
jgi:hypothetical protein